MVPRQDGPPPTATARITTIPTAPPQDGPPPTATAHTTTIPTVPPQGGPPLDFIQPAVTSLTAG